MAITGAELIAQVLKKEGVKTIFAYPGGAAMDLFDALYNTDDYEVIIPRHEQGLAHAADGYARATGEPGVCLVTSGPGATNLVTGIANAYFDSVPLVCITGQVATHLIGNDAFQEVDVVGITRGVTKYAKTVTQREELSEELKKAFIVARTGRPGPVVIDVPKDVQVAIGSEAYPETLHLRGYKPNEKTHIGQVRRALSLLQAAERPLLLIGGGVKIAAAEKELLAFVQRSKFPVVSTMMGKGALDTRNSFYIGNVGMHGHVAANWAVNHCDLLLSIGCRFNDRITGKNGTFARKATIVHVDIDPASISRNLDVDVPIVGDAKDFLQKALERMSMLPDWTRWLEQVRQKKDDHPLQMDCRYGITPQRIFAGLNHVFAGSATFTADVGQNQLWASQYLDLAPDRRMFSSGGLGTMGYGLPAAIGVQIADRKRDVICIAGDGGFQMNIQELTTAVINQLPITICLFNNAFLGNVRQWQELFYQHRYAWTYRGTKPLKPSEFMEDAPHPVLQQDYLPDFVKVAEAFGLEGYRIAEPEEIESALQKAKAKRQGPILLEFLIDPLANVYPMSVPGQAVDVMMQKEEADEV